MWTSKSSCVTAMHEARCYYIMNYSTKTETTMDAVLNLLASPVVERIKDETDGAPEAVVAAALVR